MTESILLVAPEATLDVAGMYPVVRVVLWIVMGVGVLGCFLGAISMMARPYESSSMSLVAPLLVVGIAFGGQVIVLPQLRGEDSGSAEEATPSASPEPTPSSTPEPSPTPTTEPAPSPTPTETGEAAGSAATIDPLTVLAIAGSLVAILLFLGLVCFLVDRAVKAREARQERRKIASSIGERWVGITARAESVMAKVAEAETDWDMLFTLPALTQVSYPPTTELHRALAEVRDLDAAPPTDAAGEKDHPYPEAVRKLELAWEKALQNARRVGQTEIPEDERRTIEEIQRLLALATGPGSSVSERSVAYDRIRRLLPTLRHVSVPERTLGQLEEARRGLLVAGRRATASSGDPVRVG